MNIASLWRLGVAIKLGTRTQKNRPAPSRDYLFEHTFGIKLFNDCLFKQECMSIHVGMILKNAIASLGRLKVAVKLAKLGTRTQGNRLKPARDYLHFKSTFGLFVISQTLDTFCCLKCPISTRKYLLN